MQCFTRTSLAVVIAALMAIGTIATPAASIAHALDHIELADHDELTDHGSQSSSPGGSDRDASCDLCDAFAQARHALEASPQTAGTAALLVLRFEPRPPTPLRLAAGSDCESPRAPPLR